MELQETTILISDLDDARRVLDTVLTHFQAVDLASAATDFEHVRYRPLTKAVDRVLGRLNGVLADFLLHQHEATQDTGEPLAGPEEGSYELTGQSDEELLDEIRPLGEFKPRLVHDDEGDDA